MDRHRVQTSFLSLDAAAPEVGTSRYQTWLETRHSHEVVSLLQNLQYHPHTLELQDGGNANFLLCGFTLGRLGVCSIQCGVPAVAWIKSGSTSWFFCDLLNGGSSIGSDPTYEAGKVAVAYGPDNSEEIHMSADTQLLNLRVDKADMADACRSLLGSDLTHPLSFTTVTLDRSPHLRALKRVVARLAETPQYDHPACARLELALQESALFELLLAWPNSYASYLGGARALPRSTLRARDYIHTHAAELPTLGEIAKVAGVGARALTMNFNKHLRMSPMRYLMQCRLDGVRADLLRDREVGMVTTAAYKWGFFNLGQFAARYREQFGELPHDTLRSARR